MDKLSKYDLLRRVPGRIGHRYERRYLQLHARTRDFPEALRRSEGMTCIDLGANVGHYTRRMASVAKEVIAFEPDPWAYSALRNNVADLDNVRIEKVAAGTREGTVRLHRHARFQEDPALYSSSSSVIASKRNVSDEMAVVVHQIDFIAYLRMLDEEVGILKIDIEGAEVELLETLLDESDILRRIDYIFAETHESRIPGHEPRVRMLRERAIRLTKPNINLYWQ